MNTWSFNFGCALIASAPVAAGHFIMGQEQRYILLSWLCAFVCTVFLIICSLSSLFTENPWFILLFSVPFEAVGKCLVKYFACKQKFLRFPTHRAQIGLCCGVGYSLSHLLTMFIPIIFDQPFSVDFSDNHPKYFPNALDLAIGNHAMCIFQIAISLFLLRFDNINIIIAGIVLAFVQYGFSSLSQIPIIPLKLVLMVVIAYVLIILAALSFRGMNYEELPTTPQPQPQTQQEQEPDPQPSPYEEH